MAEGSEQKFLEAVGCYAKFSALKADGLRRAQNRFFAELHRAEEELGCEFEWPKLRLVAPQVEEDAA